MLGRFLISATLVAALAATAFAEDPAEQRKQLFANLSAMEKTARERLFDAPEWEKFSRLEDTASELIRQAEQKQAELDQSGKAELYRLFVRASRLEAAEKAKTLTAEQAAEKPEVDKEIIRLVEPLLIARQKELAAKKEAGEELTLRETAIFDGLNRWRAAADSAQPAGAEAPDDLNSPRMDMRQLIWIEQIAIMETQGHVRRDLRLKDQLAEIYRWLGRRAESQEGESRDEAMRRLAVWKAKQH